MSSVLVYALHKDGAINKNSLGAISEGARVAGELGGQCDVVVVGGADLTDDLLTGLGAYGASKVFKVDGPEGLAQPAVDAMVQITEANGHKYALFGGGLLAVEIGAGLAARKGSGLAVDVTAIVADGGEAKAERPIFQDSQISTISYKGGFGVMVGRSNAFEVKETGGSATVENVSVEFSPWSTKSTLVTRGEQRGEDVNIEDATILVGGGRGLGAAEGFQLCEDLAGTLGGAVGATRAVVDAGWFPYAGQIGQTGKTVAPKLYVAVGISGAIQHKVGMQSSENIVAINKDENAPIFEFCDLGVVGDLNAILPKLTEAIKAKKGG